MHAPAELSFDRVAESVGAIGALCGEVTPYGRGLFFGDVTFEQRPVGGVPRDVDGAERAVVVVC